MEQRIYIPGLCFYNTVYNICCHICEEKAYFLSSDNFGIQINESLESLSSEPSNLKEQLFP